MSNVLSRIKGMFDIPFLIFCFGVSYVIYMTVYSTSFCFPEMLRMLEFVYVYET